MVATLTQGKTLAELAQEHSLNFFLVSYTDLLGGTRAKLVPAAKISSVERNGAFFASFASNLGLGPDAAEIAVIPDPESLIVLPWQPNVGWVASDVYFNGAPFPAAPRMILNRVLTQAAELGYSYKAGVEAEFFLLRQTETGYAIADAHDTATRPCYDQLNLMRQFDLISKLVTYMEELGWEPYQCDHEDANGQFEINWTYDDARVTADRHVFFKYMVKTLAEQQGLTATFMPKPFSHLTGNGAHIHNSLWQGDNNLFADGADDGGLSAVGYHFLGGVLAHGRGLTALCGPTINSYRRLGAAMTESGSTWSPQYISYGGNNRTHMLRIPEAGRFECRLVDGAANLYLVLAGLLAAGLEGIATQANPGQRIDENLFVRGSEFDLQRLPSNLLEALEALKNDSLLMDVIGELATKTYFEFKYSEWDAFHAGITPWEMKQYVNC
ncbi:type III glutamate--ammonia ligase [Pseudanabaena sp. FACHB-2040]|uniref:type III glutamate--ammonia ligase n=1 Tax=Pseudanabaena sp. FACHB-2040 TaxID=2692859 RepID=UPI0016869574|nr:type III glutamate--ammonia ligase [Pseudanabaena sp. FACHB-2040]MBD2257112.1 type III glutamate--ammonia ligase [Pseudanabaena sp. FACHB-2040]